MNFFWLALLFISVEIGFSQEEINPTNQRKKSKCKRDYCFGTNGEITSPGYPKGYGPDKCCSGAIRISRSKVLILFLEDLTIEAFWNNIWCSANIKLNENQFYRTKCDGSSYKIPNCTIYYEPENYDCAISIQKRNNILCEIEKISPNADGKLKIRFKPEQWIWEERGNKFKFLYNLTSCPNTLTTTMATIQQTTNRPATNQLTTNQPTTRPFTQTTTAMMFKITMKPSASTTAHPVVPSTTTTKKPPTTLENLKKLQNQTSVIYNQKDSKTGASLVVIIPTICVAIVLLFLLLATGFALWWAKFQNRPTTITAVSTSIDNPNTEYRAEVDNVAYGSVETPI